MACVQGLCRGVELEERQGERKSGPIRPGRHLRQRALVAGEPPRAETVTSGKMYLLGRSVGMGPEARPVGDQDRSPSREICVWDPGVLKGKMSGFLVLRTPLLPTSA